MMSAPSLHDLQFVRNDFPEIGLPDVWGISTSNSDDVNWNIVLSFLYSFPVSNESELTQRIPWLAENQEVSADIKQSIETYNPFLHRDGYCSNEHLVNLVTKFKEKVEDNINKDKCLSSTPDKKYRYLEASSKLLSCNIVLISLEDKTAKVFGAKNPINAKHITILCNSISSGINGNKQDQFSFCIPKEMGIVKKKQALAEILERAKKIYNGKYTSIIQNVSYLPYITEEFLSSLLINDHWAIIPLIYESPYVLSKLADAGFVTDPRTKDHSGKSAFFYALKIQEPQDIVSILYTYAANGCLKTNASVRAPNPIIMENLLVFNYFLKQLLKQIDESEEMNEKSKELLRDLCKFNEFQTEICKNLNSIKHRINYYGEDKKEKEIEISRRKDIILTILQTYETYFNYLNEESEPYIDAIKESHFEEFLKQEYYFDILDFSTALMFFDNLFLLKERLKLEKDAYLKVESDFLLHISFRKYLNKYQKLDFLNYSSQLMSFKERLSLQKQLCCFRKILEETELSEKNMVNKIPKEVVRTLSNKPEIYGEFFLTRLQKYLKAATEVTVNDLKSILVIERCLQVIGECCEESDFRSVQCILIVALSKDFSKRLNDIRHYLSHIEPHELFYRKKLEEDIEFFIEIQKELINFTELLRPIYLFHEYELDQFFLFYSMKSITTCREIRFLKKWENPLKAILPNLETQESEPLVPTQSCPDSYKRYIDDMQRFLGKQINDLNRYRNIIDENNLSCYKQIINNMISAIEEVLDNYKIAVREKITELDDHFWYLGNFLFYLTQDHKLEDFELILMRKLRKRKHLFMKLEKIRHEFQNKNNTTDTNIDGASAPKIRTLENQQSPKPKDNCEKTVNSIDNGMKYSKRDIAADNKAENFISNHVDNEIEGENYENMLQNFFDGSMSQWTTVTKKYEVVSDNHENAEDSEQIIEGEEKGLIFSEASAVNNKRFSSKIDDDCPNRVTKIMNDKIKLVINSNFLSEYKAIIKTIFLKLSDNSNEEFHFQNIENYCLKLGKKILSESEEELVLNSVLSDNSNEEFHFQNIENYCLKLRKKKILSESEKEFVLNSVPEKFRNVTRVKEEIKSLLETDNFTDALNDKLSSLSLKNQEIKEIKREIDRGVTDETVHYVEEARDYFSELHEVIKNENIKESQNKNYLDMLSEKLELSDEAKRVLLQLVLTQNDRPEQRLEFLRNRIMILKKILIDEHEDIKQLWEKDTTSRRIMYAKEKIVQLYLKDSKFQASVETLLFHCMAISRNKKLEKLWKKATNLFRGINLRNVLAHGHPLLESLGKLLDPSDLPSELVEKMLLLISDENVIYCMQRIVEQSGTDLDGFRNIMKDEKSDEFKDWRKQILECDRWESYAVLIPDSKKKDKKKKADGATCSRKG